MTERIKTILMDALRRVDPILLLCTTVLSVVSLVTVYGAVDNFGMSKLKMPRYNHQGRGGDGNLA